MESCSLRCIALAHAATLLTRNLAGASGPLTVGVSGVATAGAVYQNTAATAQGIHLGFTGMLGLTVVNTLPDNFGTYAADGLTDAWQVQYFGEGNPQAAPGVDADGDLQNNLLEFRAGYVPTNSLSLLTTRALTLGGPTFTMELSRVQPGTRYVFERTSDFTAWTDVLTLDPAAVAAPFDQPLPASGPQSFFRIRLEAAP